MADFLLNLVTQKDGEAASAVLRRNILLSLLLVALVAVAYLPVVHNDFIGLDDHDYIISNAHVHEGLNAQNVRWAFTTFDAANYHPLTWLSHALDCQLFGLNPVGHHATSVLLHAINAVLLFLLLQSATGSRWRSLFVAALFAVHPLNVESVAWASERKNVLSMMFLLLATWVYVRYARRPRLSLYGLVALLFAVGLLCKPQIITLPFLLLLLDVWPLRRVDGLGLQDRGTSECPRFTPGKIVLEKVPLLVLSAASAVITMKAQQAGRAVQSLALYSPLLRVETAADSYVRYLGKTFWPVHLAGYYPHPEGLYPLWQVLGACALLALITVAVLMAKSRRYLAVGWLWFLGTLVPMIGLVQVGRQSIADRYMYLSGIGVLVAVVWLVAEAVQPLLCRIGNGRARVAAVAIPVLVVLCLCCAFTYRQVGYWHDTETFWTHDLALEGSNYVANDALGNYLVEAGRLNEAVTLYRTSLSSYPYDLNARLGMGVVESRQGDQHGAMLAYSYVIQLTANSALRAEAFSDLGSAYRQLGDLEQARQCYEAALELDPKLANAFFGLAVIAHKQGKLDVAVRQYGRALFIQPGYAGFLLLARALEEQGNIAEARAIREGIAKRGTDLPAAQREADRLWAGK
ncbi:MAG: tetratricopeptide repeat protein [Acidobacteriota bacterium]|nr:tetratricopeptide repeat protein [Acidobacteriota bacterium]